MSVLRVNFLTDFYFGDDAVLLTLDGAGVAEMAAALADAISADSSQLFHDDVTHEFHIEPGASAVELSPTRVVWRLDHAKAAELSEDLIALSIPKDDGRTTGHFYVDMVSPAETLVVSRDEYTNIVYP